MEIEQIIQYVDEYKAKLDEERKIQDTINGYKTDLKHFIDTGNAHIHISYCHGGTYEGIYRKNDYPSDLVKKAVEEDIEKRIAYWEKQKSQVLDRILVLRDLILSKEKFEETYNCLPKE
jgi:hypothetical protein